MKKRYFIINLKAVKILLFSLLVLFTSTFSSCKKNKTAETKKAESEILLAPFQNNGKGGLLWKMNASGTVIFEDKQNTAFLNFQRWDLNGVRRYTYLQFDSTVYKIPGVGYIPGYVSVCDQNLNVIESVKLLPFNGRTAQDPDALDGHEFIYLGDGHYISMAYYEKKVSNIPSTLNPVNNCKVIACIIQEVKNNTVLFEWDCTNYPELYDISVEGRDYSDSTVAHDYAHLNSIFVDPNDNHLILSFRNFNQIIKINRSSGDIIWKLGGKLSDFSLTSDKTFLRQHHATITDGGKTLMFLDNGEDAIRRSSRILEFKLDEAAKQVLAFKAYDLPDQIFCQYMGSVQKRGNTYFVGTGTGNRIVEFNWVTDEVLLNKTLPNSSYRAFKYD